MCIFDSTKNIMLKKNVKTDVTLNADYNCFAEQLNDYSSI